MRVTVAILVVTAFCSGARGARVEDILARSGVQGGLIVVLGCDDPGYVNGLEAGSAFLVQGLDSDAGKVSRGRVAVQKAGTYGRVSVELFDGVNLPYVDNLVNLLVVADRSSRVSGDEVARVLCPGGLLLAHDSSFAIPASLTSRPTTIDGWRAAVKPVPTELGEWTHFLCGPNNNAVSKDAVVGPVSGLKWTCGPLWSRSHEFTSSVSNLVSSGGRVFYVVDEGITSVTTQGIPERWVLIARDAFNGKELWRTSLPEWRSRLGRNRALRAVPPSAQRSLVADGNRVFVSPGLGAAVMAVDSATGEVRETYEASKDTREFVKVGDSLVLYQEKAGELRRGRIARLDLKTGRQLWSAPRDRYKGESLAASKRFVVYHNGQTLVCLNGVDGSRRWTGEPSSSGKRTSGRSTQATYILLDDLVVEGSGNGITVRHLDTGKVKWRTKTGGTAMRGNDCFVARGRVWHADGDRIVGYDLEDGRPVESIDPSSVESRGHHLRCYRAKATERYLITQFRGVEFVSITGGEHSQTDWTRGACSFGVVPANGLLYVPPNPCFCYPGVKILGLNALAGRRAIDIPIQGSGPDRLQTGPAFGVRAETHPILTDSDWPTYRHDAMRHGATRCRVGENVSKRWESNLGVQLSPPVVACGQVYVAARHRHTVYALDVATGATTWSFTAGGRVDSPPTIYTPPRSTSSQGPLCLFGSADGYVYCVTADRGQLVWRFRAAPSDRRIVVFDQLESVWPVHGSVLLKNEVVYCTAGRSSMLDGGIWIYGLNPSTGAILYETNVNTLSRTRVDIQGQPIIPSYVMDGAQSDVLVSEGDAIYMGPMMFDLTLQRQATPYLMATGDDPVALDISRADYITLNKELQDGGYESYRSIHKYQEKAWPEMTREYKSRFGGFNLGDRKAGRHIAPSSGFLDDSWFNRTYWMYSDKWPGWYHAHRGAKTGQLLVVGRERTYALQSFSERNRQSPLFTPGSKGYLLLADANDNEPILDSKTRGSTKGLGYTRMHPPLWHDWVALRVRGMVEAGGVLFLAGTPDVLPDGDPAGALEGRRGGVLRAASAADGTILSQQDLQAPPVFDGLVAAAGHLFMCTEDHRVVCLEETAKVSTADQDAALARLRSEQVARRKMNKRAAERRTFGSSPPRGRP